MPHVRANGVDLHYRVDGAGDQTALLINGVGDDLEGWAFQRDDLAAAGLRVVTFDNRGCGRSSQPAGPYTSAEMAGDAKGLADALGLAPFHLIAVSMGGVIGQEYAAAWPGDLLSVVLASTYAGQPERLAGFLADMERTTQTAAGFAAQIGALLTHDCTGRLAAITTPALVLASQDDIIIKPALSRALFEALPDAQWVLLPGGHAAFLENPAAWNRAVIDFIAAHRAPAAPSGEPG